MLLIGRWRVGDSFIVLSSYICHHILLIGSLGTHFITFIISCHIMLSIGRWGTLGGGGGRCLSTVTHLCTCLRGADALQMFLVNSKPEMSLLTKNFVLSIQELCVSSFLWSRMIRSTWFASFWSLERNLLAVLSIRFVIVVMMVVVVDQVLDCCGGCGALDQVLDRCGDCGALYKG